MSPSPDLVGQKFGRLTVMAKTARRSAAGYVYWSCQCACGNMAEATTSLLKRGGVKSCGCLMLDRVREVRTKHGLAYKHPSYTVWKGMRGRCNNPNNHKYADYGGRGIRVCSEWNDFATFYTWAITNGYQKRLQIDSIDNDGPYSPDNCRFVTNQQNSKNRRDTVLLTVNNITRCLTEWCESPELKGKIHPAALRATYIDHGVGRAEQRVRDILEGRTYQNKRDTYITVDGITRTLVEWAAVCGINVTALQRWYFDKGVEATIHRIESGVKNLQGVYLTVQGQTHNLKEWSKICEISYPALKEWRRKKGTEATVERIARCLDGQS